MERTCVMLHNVNEPDARLAFAWLAEPGVLTRDPKNAQVFHGIQAAKDARADFLDRYGAQGFTHAGIQEACAIGHCPRCAKTLLYKGDGPICGPCCATADSGSILPDGSILLRWRTRPATENR